MQWHMRSFLLLASIHLLSAMAQLRMPKIYFTTGISNVFMVDILFFEFVSVVSTKRKRMWYSFLNFIIWVCWIPSPSLITRYLFLLPGSKSLWKNLYILSVILPSLLWLRRRRWGWWWCPLSFINSKLFEYVFHIHFTNHGFIAKFYSSYLHQFAFLKGFLVTFV